MTVFLVIGVVMVACASLAAVGHLGRIADAIETQNRAYGITEDEAKSHSEAA